MSEVSYRAWLRDLNVPWGRPPDGDVSVSVMRPQVGRGSSRQGFAARPSPV